MSNNLSIPELLSEIGYVLTPDKDGWRTNSEYRGGTNKTALKIYSDGWVSDYVTGERFSLETLIKRTLNIDDDKVKEYLAGKNIDIKKIEYKEKLKVPEVFDESVLKDLIPDYTYWINRDISKEVCELFQGGLCLESQSLLGKLKRRQILVIRNSQDKIVGFTGRAIDKDNKIKYKHLGVTKNWVWPAYLNQKFVSETSEVILVESPADVLKMWQCDIKNVICLFGLECSFSVVNFLLKKNPKKIIISSNNEESNRGNEAAHKIYARLKRYFNLNQLLIRLPYKKDFCEMDCDSIKEWYNKRYK